MSIRLPQTQAETKQEVLDYSLKERLIRWWQMSLDLKVSLYLPGWLMEEVCQFVVEQNDALV